ncbi:MAG: SpoIID/LytB domain-containing protein [Salinivirgaceae bacterium]
MESSPNIQVGIVKRNKLSFKLAGKFKISETGQNCYNICQAAIKNGAIELITENGTQTFTNEVSFVPCNLSADHFELKAVTIGIDFHWEQEEDQKFQGALKLLVMDGSIQAINVLPIENYLVSVISSEMSANSSLNLLKAHAIISRSWLLAQIEKQKNLSKKEIVYKPIQQSETEYIRWYDREDHTHFHVCADDHCQRYQGITRAHNPQVIKAVQETMGQVLKYQDAICDARFSKSCGGVAELFENCWEPVSHPYLSAVIDSPEPDKISTLDLRIEKNAAEFINSNPEAFCNTTDAKILSQVLNDYDQSDNGFFRWKIEYTTDELSKLVFKKSGIDFGTLTDLTPVERGTSGRLIKLKLTGTKKELVVGKELEIRRWLSPTHLYSSAITIEKKADKFIIRGAGWGHGVGLCQIGAAVMGEKGYTPDEILMHYYPGATIEKEY